MEITISFFTKGEIEKFINRSTPKTGVNFKVLGIKLEYGWVKIDLKCDDKEFSINYSDVMTDTSELIKFFAKIIDLKDDMTCILDNEGSEPLLYAKSLGDEARFIFAHDYKLFKELQNDEIDDYDLADYKIECDIIINKKVLLEEFYKIFKIYANTTFDFEEGFIDYDPESGEKYLNIIKDYLNKN